MASLVRFASFAALLSLAACGGAAASTTTTGPAPVAATNTSIATSQPLASGESFDFTLPCEGSVYFGPFAFDTDPSLLTLTTTSRSPDGIQVCGGGEWVDDQDAFLSVAGLGCVEGDAAVDMDSAYEYSPGNGGSGATPVYVRFRIADPRPATCGSTLNVTIRRP